MKEAVIGEAIRQYNTPFYLFDSDQLSDRIKVLRDAFGSKVELCYAMKANSFIIKELQDIVDYFEVCSPGEFHICERAGIDMSKIVMSGVYKKAEDIEYALNQYSNQIIYTIESLSHWQIIAQYALEHQIPVKVILRLTSGNQFGMDETILRQLIENRNNHSFLCIEGIQYFSGTQKKTVSKFEKELNMLINLCADLKEQYDFTVNKLEYGPGLPIYYFEEEKDEEMDILSSFTELVKKLNFGGKISLEMGRFIAASCGSYVTTVVDCKENKNQAYCIVDGGINHMNYYGQMLAMKKPPLIHWDKREGSIREWTVCGSLCTANDVLVKQYPFKELQAGDKLIFNKVGAYSVTEGISLFLSHQLPQVVLYSQKNGFRLARNNFSTDSLNYFSK
jgi:Diaminopimelate decarboxylase